MKPNANITIATTIVRTTSFASLIQFPPFSGVNYPMATERRASAARPRNLQRSSLMASPLQALVGFAVRCNGSGGIDSYYFNLPIAETLITDLQFRSWLHSIKPINGIGGARPV